MKRVLIFLLIILLLAAMTLACRWGDCTDCNNDGIIDGQETRAADAVIATYGAEQFHIQLTAVAGTPEP